MLIVDSDLMQDLKEWQTLIGVVLGSVVGSLVSVASFYFREKAKDRAAVKEGKRLVEISVTRTLNDMYDLEIGLRMFIARVNEIIAEIDKAMPDDTKYILEETNFPPLNVFLDRSLPNIRTRSYYIHNKLLWIDSGTQRVQGILNEMKQNFAALSRKNEFLVASVNAGQREQKVTYRSNLQNFIINIEGTLIPFIKEGRKLLMETKVYNSKMREKKGWFYKWKHEGVTFKYFKSSKVMQEYNQELGCIDRIDSVTKAELDKKIDEGERLLAEKLARHM